MTIPVVRRVNPKKKVCVWVGFNRRALSARMPQFGGKGGKKLHTNGEKQKRG